jgi:hypothetical protein
VRVRAKERFGDKVVFYDKKIGRADVAGLQVRLSLRSHQQNLGRHS